MRKKSCKGYSFTKINLKACKIKKNDVKINERFKKEKKVVLKEG
ncbi:MAG: hypothetical protein AB9856_09130 [Cellulosilyticaceae bacterium]